MIWVLAVLLGVVLGFVYWIYCIAKEKQIYENKLTDLKKQVEERIEQIKKGQEAGDSWTYDYLNALEWVLNIIEQG